MHLHTLLHRMRVIEKLFIVFRRFELNVDGSIHLQDVLMSLCRRFVHVHGHVSTVSLIDLTLLCELKVVPLLVDRVVVNGVSRVRLLEWVE